MSCGQEECNPIPICVGEPKLEFCSFTVLQYNVRNKVGRMKLCLV